MSLTQVSPVNVAVAQTRCVALLARCIVAEHPHRPSPRNGSSAQLWWPVRLRGVHVDAVAIIVDHSSRAMSVSSCRSPVRSAAVGDCSVVSEAISAKSPKPPMIRTCG